MEGVHLNRSHGYIRAFKYSQVGAGLLAIGTVAWLLNDVGTIAWQPLAAIAFMATVIGLMFGLPAWYAYSHVVVIRGAQVSVQHGKAGKHVQSVDLSLPFSWIIDRPVVENGWVVVRLHQDGTSVEIPSSTTNFKNIVEFIGLFDAEILSEEVPVDDSGYDEGGYG